MAESQIVAVMSDVLRVDVIEEAFSCFLVHQSGVQNEKMSWFRREMTNLFSNMASEYQETSLKLYLTYAATTTNHYSMKLLIAFLEELVNTNILTARMVCDAILSCEKLVVEEQHFWVYCFNLIRQIIGGVDYKGVREVMKGCREKAQTISPRLNSGIIPQMEALQCVLEYIFDRNASLLPGYFIVTEIQKAYPDNIKWPHWQLASLLSEFVESFRSCAQMVSIIGHSQMLPVVEHSGYADHLINPWRLDPVTLKFSLKGNLPYDEDLLKSQTNLLRHVLEQPYSRDMVSSMLGLQKQHKQRCIALENQLVELLILAMERYEQESEIEEGSSTHCLWLHLSSQLIYFVLFQFACFQNIVMALHDKLAVRDLRKGRDHLMWILLQFISGSIQKNPLSNFLPVLKLYDLLYTEKEPLPVPDFSRAQCTHQMAITCIWIHLLKKARSENTNIYRPIPHTLKLHYEFLQHLVMPNNNTSLCMGSDFRIALLCNAYSTNQEYFTKPMAALVDTILGSQKTMSNTNNTTNLPTVPLSMCILDSLTVHSKMSLIHAIVTHVAKLAQNKTNMTNNCNMAPALVETYSRLLVYTEIESLGIKGFISQLLPTVFKSYAWGILYTLLDMFSYRIHHIHANYRVQLLSHLHSLAAVPQTNQTQLHLCLESTALRLITGLSSGEVQPQLSRSFSEPKPLVSIESEELNRVLVLTLARAIHITGTGGDAAWCKELLNTIMQSTPHLWSQHTIQCFPPVLQEFFSQNQVPKENKQLLKKSVDEEYRKWTSMTNENDIITHFSVPGTPLFLCLIWKMIFDTDRINPIAYKILERIGARALSAHLRKFCDYILFEVTNPAGGSHINKCVDAINDIVWKYNIVTIDRLVLCLALRANRDNNESQVCFYIIQLLLLKHGEVRNRAQEFVKENSPEHWKQSNWHEKHLAFQRKYPEKFAPEEAGGPYGGSLPVYLSNVCLRFIPVLDIVVHRYIEIPQASKSLDLLLDHLGCLYKFHDRPVTYLYNTLHYYERKLRDRPLLKRTLVSAVLGSLKDVKPNGWAVSEAFQNYLKQTEQDATTWVPELNYYMTVFKRMVDTMAGKIHFPNTDWRFNEFPNPSTHMLYVTCVELMALPLIPSVVGNNLLDVICKGFIVIPSGQLQSWINCIGLVMSALPDSYWITLHDRITEIITSQEMIDWKYENTPFQLFNLNLCRDSLLENKFSIILGLAHSMWYHAGIGQIVQIPQFVKEKLVPVVRSEIQFIYLCHLVGPFLQRFNSDLPRAVIDITILLYELLEQIDKAQQNLNYIDPICDLLYHIKYMFVGDAMKTEVEGIIRKLRPALQLRLRFIVHLNVEQINSV